MTVDVAKKLIHDLANVLQAAIGYLEIGEYKKAEKQLRDSFVVLRRILGVVQSLSTMVSEVEEKAEQVKKDTLAAVERADAAKELADKAAKQAHDIHQTLQAADRVLKKVTPITRPPTKKK